MKIKLEYIKDPDIISWIEKEFNLFANEGGYHPIYEKLFFGGDEFSLELEIELQGEEIVVTGGKFI